MPVQVFSLSGAPDRRLEVKWEKGWRNFVISLGGALIGTIPDRNAIRAGRKLALPDGGELDVRLIQGRLSGISKLQVLLNGTPLPGSATSEDMRIADAYGCLFVIAGLSVVFGAFLLFASTLAGSITMAAGVVYLSLAILARRKWEPALVIALVLYVLDTLHFLITEISQGFSFILIGGLVLRLVALVMIGSGVQAMRNRGPRQNPRESLSEPSGSPSNAASPPPLRPKPTAAPMEARSMPIPKKEPVAISTTPALIVYLLDVSDSMFTKGMPGGDPQTRRITVVREALISSLRELIARSTGTGRQLRPRYHVAILTYAETVQTYTGVPGNEVVTIDELPELERFPNFESRNELTDTEKGFLRVEEILGRVKARYWKCPRPLVCHMTDGEYTGADPTDVVRRIMAMEVEIGNVLVENIYISDKPLRSTSGRIEDWEGIRSGAELAGYARKLADISSAMPAHMLDMLKEKSKFDKLAPGMLLLFPGNSPELVNLGFVASGHSGLTK